MTFHKWDIKYGKLALLRRLPTHKNIQSLRWHILALNLCHQKAFEFVQISTNNFCFFAPRIPEFLLKLCLYDRSNLLLLRADQITVISGLWSSQFNLYLHTRLLGHPKFSRLCHKNQNIKFKYGQNSRFHMIRTRFRFHYLFLVLELGIS